MTWIFIFRVGAFYLQCKTPYSLTVLRIYDGSQSSSLLCFWPSQHDERLWHKLGNMNALH